MRLLAFAAASLLASACGPFVYRIDVQQGNVVTQEAVSQLKPGMTKAEVRQALGTPLLTDIFHANRWDYYFSSAKGGQLRERQVVSLFFRDEKLVTIGGDVKAADPNAPAASPKPAATAAQPESTSEPRTPRPAPRAPQQPAKK